MTSPKTSSQRQSEIDLFIEKLKREELGNQNEADLRIANLRLEIEKLMQLQEIENQQL